jgi:hypothetical protein
MQRLHLISPKETDGRLAEADISLLGQKDRAWCLNQPRRRCFQNTRTLLSPEARLFSSHCCSLDVSRVGRVFVTSPCSNPGTLSIFDLSSISSRERELNFERESRKTPYRTNLMNVRGVSRKVAVGGKTADGAETVEVSSSMVPWTDAMYASRENCWRHLAVSGTVVVSCVRNSRAPISVPPTARDWAPIALGWFAVFEWR